jgi:hypothetical protein
MKTRSFNWVLLVGIALAGVVAASTVAASAARSTASPFELVFTGSYEPFPECAALPSSDPDLMCFDMQPATGTFTSGAPFCGSGTAETAEPSGPFVHLIRRYTCADGSGSVTVRISRLDAEFTTGSSGEWEITEGSGQYEGLHGKGTYSGELLGGNPADLRAPITFRTRALGFAAVDTAQPSIAITSASATKLRRPAGAYLIRVAFSLRDDVEGLPVVYELKVTEGRRYLYLNGTMGETASGSVSTTLRIWPSSKRMRSVNLHVRATDWIGNEQLVVHSLKLPR